MVRRPESRASAPRGKSVLQTRVVHGHRRAFVLTGAGPALLLLHGLGCDHTTWTPVIGRLRRRFTVIAPDLLGHGASAKPRGDYSLGGYANGMRDLLAMLDIDRVTVVGHSFGGGIAMQFAYQFPQYTERLMLVAPGGIGQEVTPLLRALTLPGAGPFLAVASTAPVRAAARLVGTRAQALRLPWTADFRGGLGVLDGLRDARQRDAFLHVLRAVIDWRGQVISMKDRAYLAANMPTCVMWGDRDTVFPPRHAAIAGRTLIGARVVMVPGAGHFPHEENPDRFVSALKDFVRTTSPSLYDQQVWRGLLRTGGQAASTGPPTSVTSAAAPA
jgi:pimeloyl-ACP methyl ester carboxylesterase